MMKATYFALTLTSLCATAHANEVLSVYHNCTVKVRIKGPLLSTTDEYKACAKTATRAENMGADLLKEVREKAIRECKKEKKFRPETCVLESEKITCEKTDTNCVENNQPVKTSSTKKK
jgi:hypothetical protein